MGELNISIRFLQQNHRRGRLEMFCRKGVLKKFAKFVRKHV